MGWGVCARTHSLAPSSHGFDRYPAKLTPETIPMGSSHDGHNSSDIHIVFGPTGNRRFLESGRPKNHVLKISVHGHTNSDIQDLLTLGGLGRLGGPDIAFPGPPPAPVAVLQR